MVYVQYNLSHLDGRVGWGTYDHVNTAAGRPVEADLHATLHYTLDPDVQLHVHCIPQVHLLELETKVHTKVRNH